MPKDHPHDWPDDDHPHPYAPPGEEPPAHKQPQGDPEREPPPVYTRWL